MKCIDCKFNDGTWFVCTFDKTKITLADVEFNNTGQIIGCSRGEING